LSTPESTPEREPADVPSPDEAAALPRLKITPSRNQKQRSKLKQQSKEAAPAPAPEPPPPPPPPVVQKLVATVGPRAAITLRNANGGVPRNLKPGLFTIVVRDRSKLHNVHLAGAGINRRTRIAGTGTVTWKVRLTRGTLRFYSDASPRRLRGSVRIG